ncbi:MAG: deoxyribose-phosphate aldolase [Candidatus Eremiobacteraeota bacterium]|nr:deoxyribose-phosphate aldolase [Candidatus Eremiobacteraeota bacterium]
MLRAPVRIDAVMLESRAAMLAKRSIKADAKRSGIDIAIACMDLTTLEGKDTPQKVRGLCARGIAPGQGAPSVAAICVYPNLVPAAVLAVSGSSVKVASVATAFPSGLSPLDVKLREVLDAVAAGAHEVDMVIDRSLFLRGCYDAVLDEIVAVKAACGSARLKVILEAGELGSYRAIRLACDLALEGGADFVKTATGKIGISSTPAIALLMCEAIRDHARATGREAGLKLAGGIRTTKAALGYLALVNETLGTAWLVPERFRIGASSLLDDLLMQRQKDASGNYSAASYVAIA